MGFANMNHRKQAHNSTCVRSAGEFLSLAICLSAFGSSAAQARSIFDNGFEALPPATVIVHYPAAHHFIAARGSGGGLNWSQGLPFERDGDTFTLVLDDLSGPVEWKPLLDDSSYALGPNYAVAPGQTVEVWPRFTTTNGQVITLIAAFQSALLSNTRPIYAYLPPTYLENSMARFPVVYMHDGQDLWAAHPEWAFGGITWQVDSAFDTAANNGTFKEAIVIGVASSANRIYEYSPTADPSYGGGGADLYLQMLVTELKPVVDGMLRTRSDFESTVMAGSSLGGLVTAHAGRTRPTTFGSIAALSPASWWDGAAIVGSIQTTPAAPNRPLRVYIDSGDSGPSSDSVTTTNALAAAYLSAGYVGGLDFLHVVQPGGQHNATYWAQRFPGAMQFVLGPRD